MTHSYRPPDWQPLARALSAEFGPSAADVTTAFWFLGFVAGPHDVGELRLYQHTATRRQLALSADGAAYRPSADGVLQRVPVEDALLGVLMQDQLQGG